MNVYVIYSFTDLDYVQKHIKAVTSKTTSINFFYFPPNKNDKLWRSKAKRKIKESNMVIYFDNRNCDSTDNTKNIIWELKQAEKFKKRIVVFKENADQIDSYSPDIYSKDYSETLPNRYKYKVLSINKLADFLIEQSNWNVEQYLIRNKLDGRETLTSEEKHLLLEQCKIMIETSEKLMDRRQLTGNIYTTICTALIAFIGTTFNSKNFIIPAIVCGLSGFIIWMLCYNWQKSLEAYELNNAGKFEVINEIERFLPAEMFDCEYRYNTSNGIRSYSAREKILPSLFMFLGVCLVALAIVMAILLIMKII